MNKNKLNKLVLSMAKDLMSVRQSLPLSVAVAVINYKLSSIACQMHISVTTGSGYKPTPVNTYTLTLLMSGGGKNASLKLADRFFFEDAYKHIRDKVFPYYKKVTKAKLEEEGIDRELHNWIPSISDSTTSGMYAYAETYFLTDFGCLNIEVDEIGNAVTSKAELFETLLTPYDNGDFMPVAKRTDSNSLDISGLPVNLYSFGNKVRLFNGDNVERGFLELLDEGYGRRFIFVDDNSEQKILKPDELITQMKTSEKIYQERLNIREYIKSVVKLDNFKKTLELDDEAQYEYAVIKYESDLYLSEHKGLLPAVQADISERWFKTVKLAGLYAFFDGNDKVTKQNIIEAYEVIKESSKVLADLRRVQPVHERLLNQLLYESKPVTTQTMLTYSFINSSWTKKILEYIDLAKQLASEKGYEWIEDAKGGVTYYTVIDNEKKIKEVPW